MSRAPGAPDGARCDAAGCGRRVYCGSLCRGHYRRKRCGLPVDVPLRRWGRSGWEALADAMLAYADASAEDREEFRRASHNARVAAVRYARALADKVTK